MRFYEFEAKRLLAKNGITTSPHPRPLSRTSVTHVSGLYTRGRREAAREGTFRQAKA